MSSGNFPSPSSYVSVSSYIAHLLRGFEKTRVRVRVCLSPHAIRVSLTTMHMFHSTLL